MVKHIVLFKLKDEAPADEKLAAMNSFKAAIEALPAKISVIFTCSRTTWFMSSPPRRRYVPIPLIATPPCGLLCSAL